MKRGFPLFLLLFSLFALEIPSHVFAEQNMHAFSTWEGLEADKCASIWLIKRFIDKSAVIKFFPKGELIREGIPFDTPEAELRRYHNMSTFESILRKYNLKEPPLLKIGAIIHDIEINYWGRKKNEQSRKINNDIRKIINTSKNENEILKKSFLYFDGLYQKLKKH